MREIKFRHYIKEINDFTYFKNGFYYFDNTQGCYIFNWENAEQFTGLHDKNGKEIYEGDIVKVLEVFHDKEKEYITDIIFEESAFLCKSDSSHYYDTFINSWHNPTKRYPLIEFEIIGNIHQNPELIK